ncbi:MAG: hypothetical protein HFE30_01550 [Clostridiales bacterium]|nr:hypothetical protein [Clostridiales bacterium]
MTTTIHTPPITVDPDSYTFLAHICCPNGDDIYERSSNRAYLDLCRTLRLNGVDMTAHRIAVTNMLREQIISLLASSVDQVSYDTWHKDTCGEIVEYFSSLDIGFTYGHAQKWVNMTMKYLYILDEANFSDVFDFLHIPIDSLIIDLATSELSVSKPKFAWSKIPDYDTYFSYQTKLRDSIKDISPMRWEMKAWIKG